MNDTKQSQGWNFKKKFWLGIGLVGLTLLIYFNIYAAKQLQQETARFETIEHFAELQQRQERIASEIQLMRNQMRTMYHACRTVDDFFNVFDYEITSIAKDQWRSLQVLLAIPKEGSHRLRVVVTQGSSRTEETDLYRNTIQLAPGQISEVQLEYGAEQEEKELSRSVTLKVNNEEFELPISRFSVTSTGYTFNGSHRYFRRPNQKFAASNEEGRNKIADFNFSGNGENEKVHIRVFVDSNGPMQSAADDAQTVRELIGRLQLNDSNEEVQYDPLGWYTFE